MIKKTLIVAMVLVLCAHAHLGAMRSKSTKNIIQRNPTTKHHFKRRDTHIQASPSVSMKDVSSALVWASVGALGAFCLYYGCEDEEHMNQSRTQDLPAMMMAGSTASCLTGFCVTTCCTCKKKKNK